MHKTPEFSALSRWGQVPVLVDDGRVYLQSAAIVEHLAETLGRFQGPDSVARQHVREWLYWDVDVLFPPIFNCYGVQLGQRNLLRARRALYNRKYISLRSPWLTLGNSTNVRYVVRC